MPAQEETGSVVVKTWVIDDLEDAREFEEAMVDLGLDTTLRRFPNLPALQQIRMQIDIPDKPRDPIVIESFGVSVRAITMDTTLISLERL